MTGYLKIAALQILSWMATLALVGFGFTSIRGGFLAYGVFFVGYGLLAYGLFIIADALFIQPILPRFSPRYVSYMVGLLLALVSKAYTLRMSYTDDIWMDIWLFVRIGCYEVAVLYFIYVVVGLSMRKFFGL